MSPEKSENRPPTLGLLRELSVRGTEDIKQAIPIWLRATTDTSEWRSALDDTPEHEQVRRIIEAAARCDQDATACKSIVTVAFSGSEPVLRGIALLAIEQIAKKPEASFLRQVLNATIKARYKVADENLQIAVTMWLEHLGLDIEFARIVDSSRAGRQNDVPPKSE